MNQDILDKAARLHQQKRNLDFEADGIERFPKLEIAIGSAKRLGLEELEEWEKQWTEIILNRIKEKQEKLNAEIEAL